MRARLARPRRTARGHIFVPVAAAAAVALVGGAVVAVPNAPTVHSDVQTVAEAGPSFNAGAEANFDLRGLVSQGGSAGGSNALGSGAGMEITDVTGLPAGLTFDAATGMVSGTTTAAGVYPVQVVGTIAGNPVTIPVTVTINNVDGTAPAEGQAGGTGQAGGEAGSEAAIQGSLGGEAQAGGQLTTGSEGADTIIGAVSGIVAAVTGNAGSTGTGTGTGQTTPDTDAGPLGSMANGQLDLGSLGGGTQTTTTPSPESTTPAPAPGGSSQVLGSNGTGAADGEATGEATGGIDTQSLGPILGAPLASLGQTGSTGTTPEGTGTTNTGSMVDVPGSTTTGDTTTGGDVTVPGSTTSAGSLGDVAPGLAITGAALLGLAGLSLLLNAGSSTPGSTSALPALPGSSTGGSSAGDTSTGETLTGGSGDNGSSSGGSNGETAPTVAAGAPAPKDVPGPTVANGRG